jgi:hypothetical protein
MKYNKSLKPTVTRVTPFAERAKPAPRYGGFYISKDLFFRVNCVKLNLAY